MNGTHDYSLRGLQGVPKYFKDYSNLLTDGHTGNLAVTYLGSYTLSYETTNGVLTMRIDNSSTAASGFRPPVVGYTQWWNKHPGTWLNDHFKSGPMSETKQTIVLHEDLAGRGCK